MNKAESVKEAVNHTALTRKASREAIGIITSVITDALARGEKATLVGFGRFQ